MTVASQPASQTPVPWRWTTNILFGISLLDAILLAAPALFVLWGVWPRDTSTKDDLEAAARGYAVITAIFAFATAWVIGLVAAVIARLLEARSSRRRGLTWLLGIYGGWLAVAAGYLWYANTH
jgi:hypothetical protein